MSIDNDIMGAEALVTVVLFLASAVAAWVVVSADLGTRRGPPALMGRGKARSTKA